MYAVFNAGCHQIKASQGDIVDVDFVEGKSGDKLSFDKVLMIGGAKVSVGSPYVSGAKVEAVIKEQKRAPKVFALRYTRRKNSKRIRGHRQPFTTVEIKKITV